MLKKRQKNLSYVDDILHQYSQSRDGKSYSRCYMFSILNSLSSLFNIKLSDNEIRDFIKVAHLDGHTPTRGGVVHRRINMRNKHGSQTVLPRWNAKYPKARAIQIKRNSRQFNNAISQGLPVIVSMRRGDDFLSDARSGKLEKLEYKNTKNTGHAITIIKDTKGIALRQTDRAGSSYYIPNLSRLQEVKGFWKNENATIILPI